jgi:hypothetical protein
MEQRSSLITLEVADLERSQELYERLGWRRSMAQAERVVFFQTGGMALASYPRRDLAKDANIADDGRGFSGLSLAYNRTPCYSYRSATIGSTRIARRAGM